MNSNNKELNIFSESIKSLICKTVAQILNSNNYQTTVSLATKIGENNFIGIIYRISFRLDEGDENDNRLSNHLIAKIAPCDLEYRYVWCPRPCFLREIYIYNKILPQLRQFEESKVLTTDEGFTSYPKCFGTLDLNMNECLLFEDLKARGFYLLSQRTAEITADHIRLVMQALGKLHAISFALKDQHPDNFTILQSTLMPVFSRDSEGQKQLFKTQSLRLMKVVSGENDKHLLNRLEKLFEKEAADIATECSDPKTAGTATVVLHGDAWQNNFMFRYDDHGKPVEVMLLDWQLSQCASPVIDVSFFIFCSTTKTLRDDHYEEFLKTYHDSLSQHIQRLGSDPEKWFPYELMLEHFRKFGRLALLLVSILLPVIMADDESKAGVDEPFEINSNDRLNKVDSRLKDVIADMVRLGYI